MTNNAQVKLSPILPFYSLVYPVYSDTQKWVWLYLKKFSEVIKKWEGPGNTYKSPGNEGGYFFNPSL